MEPRKKIICLALLSLVAGLNAYAYLIHTMIMTWILVDSLNTSGSIPEPMVCYQGLMNVFLLVMAPISAIVFMSCAKLSESWG